MSEIGRPRGTSRLVAPSSCERRNEIGQPIGPALEDWSGSGVPTRDPMQGRLSRLEALDPSRHFDDLWKAVCEDETGGLFTYLPYGPFASPEDFRSWIVSLCSSDDPLFFSILDLASGCAVGLAALQRMAPAMGTIEVAHLLFTQRLQRASAATEAMYLMMQRVFAQLGYRRYEWKCDSLNAPSRRAAERLGFTFEGVHRQAIVYKGRSRDTAWYSILDSEWPDLEDAFRGWLDESNFEPGGNQRRSLASFRSAHAEEGS